MILALSEVDSEIVQLVPPEVMLFDLEAYDDVWPTFDWIDLMGRLDVVAMINAYFVDVSAPNQTLLY